MSWNLVAHSTGNFFTSPSTTESSTLSLHDALPICRSTRALRGRTSSSRATARGVWTTTEPNLEPDVVHTPRAVDRKSTRLNSSHANSSYAVFCLKKKNNNLKNENFITEQAQASQTL